MGGLWRQRGAGCESGGDGLAGGGFKGDFGWGEGWERGVAEVLGGGGE